MECPFCHNITITIPCEHCNVYFKSTDVRKSNVGTHHHVTGAIISEPGEIENYFDRILQQLEV